MTPTGTILSKGLPRFMRLYADVAMTDGAGWNEHDGARGELDDKPEVEKDDVPAFDGVVGTQCTDGT